jgi:hypothetical protein
LVRVTVNRLISDFRYAQFDGSAVRWPCRSCAWRGKFCKPTGGQLATKTAHPIAHPDGYLWRLDKSFTQKYFVCTQELRLGSLVHTQEVTGSSPVAPTNRINRLRPHIPEKASTTSTKVGGQLGGLIFLRTSRRSARFSHAFTATGSQSRRPTSRQQVTSISAPME